MRTATELTHRGLPRAMFAAVRPCGSDRRPAGSADRRGRRRLRHARQSSIRVHNSFESNHSRLVSMSTCTDLPCPATGSARSHRPKCLRSQQSTSEHHGKWSIRQSKTMSVLSRACSVSRWTLSGSGPVRVRSDAKQQRRRDTQNNRKRPAQGEQRRGE
jgi:hypothetical protein